MPMSKFLLVVKAPNTETAIDFVIKRFDVNEVRVLDDSWKMRQTGSVTLLIEIDTDVTRAAMVWQWFGETEKPAPFPDGTLLYFKEMI